MRSISDCDAVTCVRWEEWECCVKCVSFLRFEEWQMRMRTTSAESSACSSVVWLVTAPPVMGLWTCSPTSSKCSYANAASEHEAMPKTQDAPKPTPKTSYASPFKQNGVHNRRTAFLGHEFRRFGIRHRSLARICGILGASVHLR